MGRKTYSIKYLIALLMLLLLANNSFAETIDLSTCALNTQTIENHKKPNQDKNDQIVTVKKTDTNKTSSKSKTFGIFKLLIPGTLR